MTLNPSKIIRRVDARYLVLYLTTSARGFAPVGIVLRYAVYIMSIIFIQLIGCTYTWECSQPIEPSPRKIIRSTDAIIYMYYHIK